MAGKKTKEKNENNANKGKITKDMLIGDLVSRHPAAVEVLFKNGIHCVGCPMTSFESIEQGCRAHGMDDEKIDKMIEEMNKAVSEDAKSDKPALS